MSDTQNRPVRMTPKGVIAVALDGNIAATEGVWDALREFGFRSACKGEMDIPGIVLDDGGGDFISVRKSKPTET